MDYDGMMPTGPGDPPIEYTGSSVAIGDNVTNDLGTVVVTAKSSVETSGSSKGTHFSEDGNRFYGFKSEGTADADYWGANGSVSGFSAGSDSSPETGGKHGSASVYGLEAKAGLRAGTKNNNISVDGEGSAVLLTSSF